MVGPKGGIAVLSFEEWHERLSQELARRSPTYNLGLVDPDRLRKAWRAGQTPDAFANTLLGTSSSMPTTVILPGQTLLSSPLKLNSGAGLTAPFSPDDQMNPVYCVRCRAHVPRAVSNANGGVCSQCYALATTLAQQQIAAHQQLAVQRQQAQFNLNSGLGSCPQCSSTNVQQIHGTVANGSKNSLVTAGAVLLLLGLCIWPLFIIGLVILIVGACMQPTNPTGHISRTCNCCGFRWPV